MLGTEEHEKKMLELPMYLQRPSSARSQDVRHILSGVFHEYYNRDVINKETIEKLSQSLGECDDEYHNFYVNSLREVYEDHEKDLAEAAMLERHIMQAQARAMSADEKEINRFMNYCDNYSNLGLPPPASCFQSCLDKELLRKNNLLVPSDYMKKREIIVPPPQPPSVPPHQKDTQLSLMRLQENIKQKLKSATGESMDESGEISNKLSDEKLPSTHVKDNSKSLAEKAAEHHTWKGQISQEVRQTNRGDLQHVEAKVNYLHNSRFDRPEPSETLIQHKYKKPKYTGIVQMPQSKKNKQPAVIFLVTPPSVVFTNYTIGQMYQQTFKVTNVSKVLRSCRIIPPETSFFSVDHGRFPSDQGLIAPGMSCLYTVSFSPDSLSDYDDIITIQSQADLDIKIRIQGRRPPPVLSLPPSLNLGHCLVGGKRAIQFVIKNTGGSGKFCILPSTLWPATNFKSCVSNTFLMIGVFEIRPSVFELLAGECGVIEIVFSPQIAQKHKEDLIVVCDNCHVIELSVTGEGETACVHIDHIDGGESHPLLGDITDRTSDHHIRFSPLMPFTYTDKIISVHNDCHIDLQYEWTVYKPNLLSNDNNTTLPESVIDINSVFGIYPVFGELRADASTTFTISFAPATVGHFHNFLHLILHNIPKKQREMSIYEESQTSLHSTSDSQLSITAQVVHDLDIIEVDLKGECDPIKVVLKPYAMLIPGKLTMGSTFKKHFSMENYSIGTVKFHWQSYNMDHIIDVEPQVGDLGSNMGMDFELKVTGVYPGLLKHDLKCFIENLDTPLNLHVSAEFSGAEISVDKTDIHFGLIQLGAKVSKDIIVTNLSQFTCKYRVKEHNSSGHAEVFDYYNKFVFSIPDGELRPLKSETVQVTFEPVGAGTIHALIQVEAQDGNCVYVNVFADVQKPQVCLQTCEIELEEIYLNTPRFFSAVLVNQTLLPTYFHWGRAEGKNVEDVTIVIDQNFGLIDPRATVECSISLSALKIVEVNDLRLPCVIEGNDQPIYANIVATVKGINVLYAISCDGVDGSTASKTLCLDFGEDVPLGSTPKLYLHIQNKSAIPAHYTVDVVTFAGETPVITSAAKKMPNTKKGLLAHTTNLADPHSKLPDKAHKDMCKQILGTNQGVAFVPSIREGTVAPFDEDVIQVTAYSDMWGVYVDQLTVKVETCLPRVIPIKMSVAGLPLSFQALGPNSTSGLTLRMGTHSAGATPVKRIVRINNNSPCDIRLDWRVFEMYSSSDRLLDLILYCGEAFPLKDADGKEIEPETPSDLELVNYTFSTRPDLAHLHICMHDGIPSDGPFVIKPDQIVVPKRGHAIVNIWLLPPSPTNFLQSTDYSGYALAYLSLLAEDKDLFNVTRSDAYTIDTLRVEFTATINPALLTVSYGDEEEMSYACAISEIIDSPQSEIFKEASMTLSNDTEMPLTFEITMKTPFLLLECDIFPDEREHKFNKSEIGTLFPRQSVIVKIAFCLNSRILLYMQLPYNNSDASLRNKQMTSPRLIEINREAIISFSSGVHMTIPLKATVYLPSLKVSAQSHDFGTCLVGQTRELHLQLSNSGMSDSHWTVSFDTRSESCTNDTFVIKPTSGCLDAYRTHVSNSKTTVIVYFTAQHETLYEAVILFNGLLGEEPGKVYVTGEGSYDQKHYTYLNK